jgi:tetratricopeptide (TPR) repeat protein
MGDIFAFQDDVADTVAARLALHISAAERRRILEGRDPELRAYGLVLRGQELSLRYRREANLHARRLLEQAVEVDPEYGRAYAGLSRTFNLSWRYRWADKPEACLSLAVDLAHESLNHDPTDPRGYSELGFACLYKRQHEASLAAYEKAVELNPNDADILAEMGDCLTYSGDPSRAVEFLNRAMRLNPYYPDWYLWYLADAQFTLGNYEGTIHSLLKMRDQSEAHRMLSASYAHLGHEAEARRHAEQVLQAHPHFSLEHWSKVPPFKDRADLEHFVEGLRKAGLK